MSAKHQQGFTIIEVSLFLAISALLAVLLLGGWTTMINTQRYKDSNKTLQTFLQDQYNLVYNVENGRDNSFTCIDGRPERVNGGGAPRGQTDCILMGRYIDIKDGQTITVRAIVGAEPTVDVYGNDFDVISAYMPNRSGDDLGVSRSELSIPWGAVALGPNDSDEQVNQAIAIIRSPVSGNVYTFTLPVVSSLPELDDDFISSDTQNDVVLCLEAGAPLSGERTGVIIRKNASSQSFVQSISENSNSGGMSC